MTINAYTSLAVARQRAIELGREAAAYRSARAARAAGNAGQSANRPHPERKTRRGLIPAGAQKR